MAIPAGVARGSAVVAAYAALSVVMTWPLATRLGTSLAGDFGDPTFVAWVMGWVDAHLTRVLTGDLAAWGAMWNAPIFAPEAATLTYSDHFLAQAVLALPIWWATGNALLAYNVVFLTTMTLTAVAAHGLAVRWWGVTLAGVVAALLCTFNDYRTFWSLSHLQILSIQWWLFGLWGLDVFIARGSRRALAGATLSLVALHYSSSYLMAYCAPFTAAVVLWSMARHDRLADRRVWTGVIGAAVVSVVAVAPVMLRYLAMRETLGFARTLDETSGNGATIAAYIGALPWLGPLLLIGVAGVAAPATAVGVSRRVRGVLLALAGLALLLGCGPLIRYDGQAASITGPYEFLRLYVPAFDGLRVPHRFVTIAASLLALLGGAAAVWLCRWRLGIAATVVAVALVTRHGWQPPFPIDGVLASGALAAPPAYLRPSPVSPRLYQFVAAIPADAVVAELPFGELSHEIRYTFFSGQHRRRTLNGYSGVLPDSYLARQKLLAAPLDQPEASWTALRAATHVVVHDRSWPDGTGARIRVWLEGHGARVVASVDGAWLYQLPPH